MATDKHRMVRISEKTLQCLHRERERLQERVRKGNLDQDYATRGGRYKPVVTLSDVVAYLLEMAQAHRERSAKSSAKRKKGG